MLKRATALAAGWLLLLPVAVPCLAFTADRAVIVVLDGIRASEAFDDPAHAHVPRMWNDLRPLGVWIPQFRNDGDRRTVPGHAAVLTGIWQYLPNDGTVRPPNPTLFEFFRAATGAPPSAAWLVTGKDKLDVCAYSTSADYGAPDSARADCAARANLPTYAAFAGHLLADRPVVSLLQLPDTDLRGHEGNWQGYLDAIAEEDSLVHELWLLIESDPVLSGKTALLVTADHGRHDDAHGGFVNHGDACEGCSRLPFLALGPDFVPGRQGTSIRTQRDICPTIGALLGFPTPGVHGQVMSELWNATTGAQTDARPPAARVRVHPNPAAAGMRFTWHGAGGAAALRLRVWDVSGRLVHEERNAPAGQLLWDGRDLHGRPAPAGSYFWEIDGDGLRERGPLTVVR